MNKLFILSIILAVCLVSAHAFAKRDTAAVTDKSLDGITKDLDNLGKDVSKKLQETFDPEAIKKFVNDGISQITKAVNDISTKVKESTSKQ